MSAFEYSNLNDRPPGPFVRAASTVSRGVREVQSQVAPYAEQWRLANVAAVQAAGPLWVALGDSMTQGVGATAFDRGWVGQLAGQLSDSGQPHRLVNLAVSGARVSDVMQRQLAAMAQLDTVPDLVTLMVGSNNLMRRKYRVDVVAEFAELIENLPLGTVVSNLPNPHREAAQINALIRQAAERGEVIVADMTRPRSRSWRGKLAADHFHPNDRGYTGLATVFADAIGISSTV